MPKQIRKQNSIKYGTIEMILLLLLQSGKMYGYQITQELSELSDGGYELKETTMYPTLYRLNENKYIDCEKVKVGERRFRVYYSITDAGRTRLKELLDEYNSTIAAIQKVIDSTTMKDNNQENLL